MAFLWISIGVVYVYAVRFVIMGNPSYTLVQRASPVLLRQVIVCLEEERRPEDEHVALFMSHFFRQSLLTVMLLVIEFCVIIYFLASYPGHWVPWALLVKNFIMLAVGYRQHQESEEDNVIETIRLMPPWVVQWERLGYLATALGFMALFLLATQTPMT